MLWAHRRLGLRRHDGPPEGFEIVIPLLIWSFLFEVLIPARREWSIPAVADPYDVLSYCVGTWRLRSSGGPIIAAAREPRRPNERRGAASEQPDTCGPASRDVK